MMDRKMVNFIKEQYPPGTRIRLNSMEDPYHPILPGTEGEVDFVDDEGQIFMKWDNGRTLPLVPGEDSFTVLLPKLTTIKLYMPLTADLYERNEYGDFDDSSTLLEGSELRGYQDQITAALVKNRMPEETERGLMHWYDEADSVDRKVRTAVFTVEERDRQLWGVAECRVAGELSDTELENLKEYLTGQASDGWGEGFEQRDILVDGGSELYVHLWNSDEWSIQTEQELFSPKLAEGLPELCFSTLSGTGELICIKRGESGYYPSDWSTDDPAHNGVEAVWCTPYESAGAKVSGEGDKTTGGGLAWGGGCSPSLTPDLVMFTDNADPVKLLALDMKTGKIVASLPVLDDLPEGYQVAVENSAIVYDDSEGTVSTIVCNWFGAGSAGLADPDSDSSIQSYANIYDMNWLTKGNCMIAPGVERVDTVKTDSGYEMKSIWSRNDLSDTSILKLSTATGYIYGYVQDLESGMWQYIILDFATGKTVFTMDVSNKFGYNNMAIGMYAGNSGNALYCPTGYLELLCLQDRFVYLPEMPYRKVDLDKAARNVLTQEQFEQDGGEGTVASWRNTVTVENVHPNTTVSFRMNNLSGDTAGLKLYAYGADRKLAEVGKELWSITDETGAAVDTLSDGTLYELRVSVADGSAFDLSEAEREIKISVVLAK